MESKHKTAQLHDCEELAHHWMLDEKDFGVCKHCGASKQFHTQVSFYQPSAFGRAKADPTAETWASVLGGQPGDG